MKIALLAAGLVVFSCGGKDTGDPAHPGQSNAGSDLDQALDSGAPVDPNTQPDPSTQPPAASSDAPYQFVVQNTHTDELVFNMDRGWGGSVLAYSGVPPNAVSILPFPKHCTASCDTAGADLCPKCEEPEHLKDIREAQQLERLAAGGSLTIPWDGQVHVYEKVPGKRGCECYKKEAAPAAEYTVNVCGLRLTLTADKSSKIQCVQGKMSVPASGPQSIPFAFPAPASK